MSTHKTHPSLNNNINGNVYDLTESIEKPVEVQNSTTDSNIAATSVLKNLPSSHNINWFVY